MGLSAPSKEVQQLINRLDSNGDGLISYNEFVVAGSAKRDNKSSRRSRDGVEIRRPHLDLGTTELMSRKLKTMIRDAAWNEKSLRRVFKKFDANENGEITSREFKQAFNKLNLFATNKEIESLVDKLDRTGDGVVRYEDFIAAAEVEAGPGSKEQRKIKEKWGDASDDEYDRRRRRRRKYEDSDDEDRRRKYEDSDDDRRKYRDRQGP